MSKTLTEKKEYPKVTPDIYPAEVLEVKEEQNTKFPTYDDGNPRIEVIFKFRITDGEFEDQFVWGRTTATFSTSEKCKLRKWTQAILNLTELPVGFVLEFEDLVSKNVRIFVQHTEQGNAKVADVLPAKMPSGGDPVSVSAGSGDSGYSDFGEEPF